ncbi:MAG: alpha-amylase family glycosyl hydrolase [Chloroflexota bacterium]|nr:alpha-amylase family glycosyl hydrolase [Chloroflexota bacterium]
MRKLFQVLGVMLVSILLSTNPVSATQQLQATNELPWWNDRVFYEIFVRSFYDSNGDGIGDLRGVIEKLDYLRDLGIGGIWLMPIQEATRYHGYDVDDYRAVNADYGTAEDFRALMAAAHERDIVVIVDLVLNHTSYLHPWFQASLRGEAPYADWYVWRHEDPGYRGPDGQPVWHQYEDRYYYGVFWEGMPDLNLTNPDVTAELHDIARYWLEDLGVDGFRLDAVKHFIEDGETQENTPESRAWAAEFNRHVHAINPEAMTVGEIWSTSFEVADYVPNSVNIAFEFDLATAMVTSAQQRNPGGIASLQARALDLYPFGQYASFLTNHDQNRVMSELRGDAGAAKVAASLLLTAPGVPFLYYGEEIGMMGVKPDERIRTPMQWTADPVTAGFTTAAQPWQSLADDGLESNVTDQADDPDSLFNHYRALIRLRNEQPALRRGTWTLVDSDSRRVYAFLRQYEGDTLLIIINLDRNPVTDYALSLEESTLNAISDAAGLYGGTAVTVPTMNDAGGFDSYLPVPELAARSTLIIQLRSS